MAASITNRFFPQILAALGAIILAASPRSMVLADDPQPKRPNTIVIPKSPHPLADLPSPSKRVTCSGTLGAIEGGVASFEISMLRRFEKNATNHFTGEAVTISYPIARVGMVLPVCGVRAKVVAFDEDGIKFDVLDPDKRLPQVKEPGEEFPLVPEGRLQRVPEETIEFVSARDTPDGRVAELKRYLTVTEGRKRFTRQEAYRNLKAGSTLTLGNESNTIEYRIVDIVLPDAKNGVVGWVTFCPIMESVVIRPQ